MFNQLKSFFKQVSSVGGTAEQRIFLADWVSNLTEGPGWEPLAAALATDAKAVQYFNLVTELVFENGRLVRAFEYQEGERDPRDLHPEEVGLPFLNLPPKRVHRQRPTPQGPHQLGGEQPTDFQSPPQQLATPFQYLGYLSCSDPLLDWLPFDLHLTCPIYLDFPEVFLDYTDPNRPVVLNHAALVSVETSFKLELSADSEIVFEPLRFEFAPVHELNFGEENQAGIPSWIQHPYVPICPKTGHHLQFVCQLYGGVNTLRSNIEPRSEYYRRYFEHLNFWGDGALYVFFEPESKVACYYIQNT